MDALIQSPAFINEGEACCAACFDAEHQRRHNGKHQNHHRAKHRHHDEHLSADSRQVFALDDCQKFCHSVSPTFSMKMSLKLGSTNSNLVTRAPAATKRLNNSCASAPSASNASTSSLRRSTFVTSVGSLRTRSPSPSMRSATALRPKPRLISRNVPSRTLLERLIMQMSSQIRSASSI